MNDPMTSTSFDQLFRTLASFSPQRASLADAPWEAYVEWAIVHGLAPLAAYNLEYRLAGASAPEWARERLLTVYQGSLNDNVMKLVNLKRSIGAIEGRKLVLWSAASFADSLYPHVAFRPVPEVRIYLRGADLDGFTGFLRHSDFQPERDAQGSVDPVGATRVLSDGRTQLLLHTQLLGAARASIESELWERLVPMRAFGPSVYRFDLEDALLLHCLEQARLGYEVPMLSFVDLRELLRGAPDVSGPYSRPLDAATVRARAQAWGLERAAYASLAIVSRLFPDVAPLAAAAAPELKPLSKRLLDRWVVTPMSALGQRTLLRGGDRLRRALSRVKARR